jgi:hypothetical protein
MTIVHPLLWRQVQHGPDRFRSTLPQRQDRRRAVQGLGLVDGA